MNITNNELALLNWIAYNEMTTANGARPADVNETHCYFWADEFAKEQEISVQAARGIAGSLAKKGLAYFQKGDEFTDCGMTDDGFAAWDELTEGETGWNEPNPDLIETKATQWTTKFVNGHRNDCPYHARVERVARGFEVYVTLFTKDGDYVNDFQQFAPPSTNDYKAIVRAAIKEHEAI